MSVGVMRHAFDYDPGPCLCEDVDSTICTDRWLKTHVKPAFQTRLLMKLSETFRMFWDDSCSEDLATYYATEKSYDYYRQMQLYYQ